MEEPFKPECDQFSEGTTSEQLRDDCERNPGHKAFFPVADLEKNGLPKELQNNGTMDYIRWHSQLTAQITVSRTSPHRPKTWPGTDFQYPYWGSKLIRTGTGYIYPAFHKELQRDSHWCIYVYTARHVVFDKLEAENTTCRLFFKSDGDKEVREIYGTSVCNDKEEVSADVFWFRCVTQDETLIKCLKIADAELEKMTAGNVWLAKPFIISHPHGLPQQITFGNLLLHARANPSSRRDKIVKCIFPEKSLKFRFPNSSSSQDNYQESPVPDDYVTVDDVTMAPGEQNKIALTAKIPRKAEFLYYTNFTKCPEILVFKPGTRFFTCDSQELFLPPGTEFLCPDTSDIMVVDEDGDEVPVEHFDTYDIDTCNGSSGALIHTYLSHIYHGRVHCGELKDSKQKRSSNYGNDFLDRGKFSKGH